MDEVNNQQSIKKTHTEELSHAKDLLEYVEDREKEMARKQKIENLPDLSSQAPPTKQKGFFSGIANGFKKLFGGK